VSDLRILAFDTSAAHCAAALLSGDRITADRLEHLSRGQAERLMPLLEEMLAAAGLGWRDLDAVGVGIGPGNFTGIRISVAAARGLALSLGVPAVGVTLFEVLRAGTEAEDLLVSLEGPRGSAYLQRYAGGAPAGPPFQIAPGAGPVPGLAPQTLVLGYAAADIAAPAAARAEDRALSDIAPRIARRAAERLAAGGPVARPAPLYIRPADAAPPREAPPVILP
jgi:tRNA threonylcarbamoyladenosine biosynthesis protein TsaB